MTIGGYQTDTVWRTTNGGTTWSQRTGSGENALPAIQVNTIRIHPSNRNWIYVDTDLGVYASEDKGASWSRTPRRGDHEGPANTETAELFWQGDTLVAATHGRGMYRTRPLSIVYVLAGPSWSPLRGVRLQDAPLSWDASTATTTCPTDS